MTDKPTERVTVHDALEADRLDVELSRWRILSAKNADDDAKKIIKRGKVKAEDLIRAAQRFADAVKGTDDWWVLYVAAQCGRVIDNDTAIAIFDSAIASGWGTSALKKEISEANKTAKPTRQPRAKVCPHCGKALK